ncbi:MAG: HNH endonuclease [Kiritimatiellaeota bacterium]|nr:HNH endonuclease [Kiritimatiellota bacterium]
MGARNLHVELSRFRRDWKRKHNDEWNYHRAQRVFCIFFSYLTSRKRLPTSQQFDALYRALRYEGKCGPEAKLAVYERGFPPKILRSIDRARKKWSGIVGGTLGSIEHCLRKKGDRERLWQMLRTVAKAKDRNYADRALENYAKHPVSGLGIGVISTFVWVLQPMWYPIVNDGSIRGFEAVIYGFVKTKRVDVYIHRHVPRLRSIAVDNGFRSFDEFDAFFHRMTRQGACIRKKDRVPFQTPIEIKDDEKQKGFIEGRRHEVIKRVVERDARNRRAALEDGYVCRVCDFTFEKTYGVKFAEVHHIRPLARSGRRQIDPRNDLLVVCSNCHTMLHPGPRKTVPWRKLRGKVRALRKKK